ncbi:MAG: YqaJ viral recombinase family protein [Sedimentisphaerales bacterium]|nr:YqaJ viral recombinase family protein [Sedimentisphaerales bacterium]
MIVAKHTAMNALKTFISVLVVDAGVAQSILMDYSVGIVAMQIIDCIQNSDEWYQARLGIVTSSNFHKVLNKKTGRGLYMRKLAAERLTGVPEESYKNANMENGNIVEDDARNFYAMANDCIVNQVGFVKRDDDVGCSPDGLVGDDGIIEIKCPLSSTHIENIITNKMPTEYIPQVQGILWITERQWCDFVSYDSKVYTKPIHIIRVERDNEYIVNLAAHVAVFVKELKAMINMIDEGF